MSVYGVTLAGFVTKDQATITSELQAAYQGTFGANIPFGQNSIFDQDVGTLSEQISNLWQLGLAIYQSQFPDTAQGAALANTGAVTGKVPNPATYSTTVLTLTGTAGTLIPAGSQVGILNTQTIFATTIDFTIPSGGSGTVPANATVTGPLTAPAGTLTNIVTPIAGWASATNAANALVGTDTETDAAFRARRATELVVATGGSAAAVANYFIVDVPGVTFCGVKVNRTDTTDVNGLPPHSYAVTVIGGTNAAIAQALWATVGAGMATSGTQSASVNDSFGNAQTVYWNVGIDVPIYMSVTLTRDATNYPTTGDTLVETALENYINAMGYGAELQDWLLQAQLGGIPGIDAAPVILFDRNPSPTGSANLTLAANEKPSLVGTNIAMH